MINPDKSNQQLTVEDRKKWRSVLKWCDECDERAINGSIMAISEGRNGNMLVIPIGTQ